jgi:hypothetical protein
MLHDRITEYHVAPFDFNKSRSTIRRAGAACMSEFEGEVAPPYWLQEAQSSEF